MARRETTQHDPGVITETRPKPARMGCPSGTFRI